MTDDQPASGAADSWRMDRSVIIAHGKENSKLEPNEIEFPAWVFSDLDGVEFALNGTAAPDLFLYDYEGEVITVYDSAGFQLRLLEDEETVVRDSLRYEEFVAAARHALGRQRVGRIRWWHRETRPFMEVPEEDVKVIALLAQHFVVDRRR